MKSLSPGEVVVVFEGVVHPSHATRTIGCWRPRRDAAIEPFGRQPPSNTRNSRRKTGPSRCPWRGSSVTSRSRTIWRRLEVRAEEQIDEQVTIAAPSSSATRPIDNHLARETPRPDRSIVVPAIVAAAGDHAMRRFLEFFAVTIDNKNTRDAYLHACRRFFAWCDRREDIEELVDIEPMHVAAYIRSLGKDFEKPTVKQHLAAIRMLFDWLVTGQVAATGRSTSSRPARPRC